MTAKNIKIHIPYGDVSAIGPGKADLLEAIESNGSISAAARAMGMSEPEVLAVETAAQAQVVFEAIRSLISPGTKPRKRIGYLLSAAETRDHKS